MYAEPLYAKRAAVVTGAEEPPATTTSEELATEQDDQADVPPGIPDFWLNVLRANPLTQSKVSFTHYADMMVVTPGQFSL